MMKGLKKWRLFSLLAVMTVFLSACGEDYISTLRPAGAVGKEQFNLLLLSTSNYDISSSCRISSLSSCFL